jgi:hypothetical protein
MSIATVTHIPDVSLRGRDRWGAQVGPGLSARNAQPAEELPCRHTLAPLQVMKDLDGMWQSRGW